MGCWDAGGTVIGSPFDYRQNALLYTPSDMPTPDHNGYQRSLEQAVQQAALAAEGRTLVLFTSHSHLRTTAEANPARPSLQPVLPFSNRARAAGAVT